MTASQGLGLEKTAVGLTYAEYVPNLVASHPDLLDYVEVAFEQLLRVPDVATLRKIIPIVLHCASLSLAGNSLPCDSVVDKLAYWIKATGTPWLGEHIAYVSAKREYSHLAEHDAVLAPKDTCDSSSGCDQTEFNVGYTVSPQLSEPILNRIVDRCSAWENQLKVPILLENGPIYFNMPGSAMNQVEFINELCLQRPEAQLLLDLSHLAITCSNLSLDPLRTLLSLPLGRVTEVHVSGAREEGGIVWDDHTLPAPDIVFKLLDNLLAHSKPRAVTIEYNWDANFPRETIIRDVARVREIINTHQMDKMIA